MVYPRFFQLPNVVPSRHDLEIAIVVMLSYLNYMIALTMFFCCFGIRVGEETKTMLADMCLRYQFALAFLPRLLQLQNFVCVWEELGA